MTELTYNILNVDAWAALAASAVNASTANNLTSFKAITSYSFAALRAAVSYAFSALSKSFIIIGRGCGGGAECDDAPKNATDESQKKSLLDNVDFAVCDHSSIRNSQQTEKSTTQRESINAATLATKKKGPNDFELINILGEGSYGTVYLGVDVATKQSYAIKVCDKHRIRKIRKQFNIKRERDILQMLSNSPGIVTLKYTFQDVHALYFVMTYAKNGDLLQYLHRYGNVELNYAKHIVAELVLSCEQMHQRNIVHRDLKPENILLDNQMHTLVTDFGSAKIVTNKEAVNSLASFDDNEIQSDDEIGELLADVHGKCKHHNSFVGTAQFISPEVLKNQPASTASDLWALGCIIYQLLAGMPIFNSKNYYDIFEEVLACKLLFPNDFDKTAENLVRNLVKLNPAERLGAQDEKMYTSLRAHEFFSGIDFENIHNNTPPTTRQRVGAEDK